MTQLILLFVLIATGLFLICFVTLYAHFRTRSYMKRDHIIIRKQLLAQAKKIQEDAERLMTEVRKEYEHVLINVKNLKKGMENSLDMKHDQIEAIGDGYIKNMKKIKKEHESIHLVK